MLNALKAGSPKARDIQQRLLAEAKTIDNYRKLNTALSDAIKNNKELKLTTEEKKQLEKDINYEYEQNLKVLKKNQQIQEDVNKTAKRLAGGLFTLGDASIDGAEKNQFLFRCS